ncbi:MAG: hypothetical protein F4029_02605 [Gammaproteobacteria bacterium]|nr:hypothetical protein [Gammaproteobacteria bacterium]MYF27697.1 hypothetical protein [Gammaproteobacteria bacterium]MYK45100.1 hypothetical protein [Gammaproteobacteria bacterium]
MLDELGIVGISWRQVGSEALADYSLPVEQRDERLRAFARAEALVELAYVETCNRVELVFATDDGSDRDLRAAAFELLTGAQPAPGEAERKLRAWRSEGACEHLFLVAAGLDSAAVGEVEIAGQVRLAHERAQATGLCGPRLSLAFEEAGRIAGAIRGGTALGEGSVSLAEVAMTHVRRRLAETPGTVALIGVSAMTERAALSLAKAGAPFVVVNRTITKATELARRFGADCLSLDEFRRSPPALAVILSATGSPEPVLDPVVLERLATVGEKPPLGIDMAVPADIDPDGCRHVGMARIGMDEIVRQAEANRDARLLAAADARALVDEALPRLRDKVVDRVYGPLFGALQKHYQETATTAVQRLAKDLGELDAETRGQIDAWAGSLARRMAHLPTVGLKGLMRYGPEGSLDAFLKGLDPERRSLLRRAVHGDARHTDVSEEADDPKA